MLSVPTGRAVVERVATPLDIVDIPSEVVPLKNWTVPVAPDGTVALKTTAWPKVDELIDDVSLTVVVVSSVAVPVRTTCCDVATPLSASVRTPAREPTSVGENVTAME